MAALVGTKVVDGWLGGRFLLPARGSTRSTVDERTISVAPHEDLENVASLDGS